MSDYTPTGRPIDQNRGLAKRIRDEFALIATSIATKAESSALTAINAALALKGAIAGQVWTGTHDFTGATTKVATPATATEAATKDYADQLAFGTALPDQTGNAGKVPRTDGSATAWQWCDLPTAIVSGTSGAVAAGYRHVLTNAAATAVTAPATPADGDPLEIVVGNALTTNTLDLGAKTVIGPAGQASGVITLNARVPFRIVYSSSLGKWVMV